MTTSDLRLAIRLARQHPIANLTAVVALSTAIGISLLAYVVVQVMLPSTLPLPNGDQIEGLLIFRPAVGGSLRARADEVRDWQRDAEGLVSIGAFEKIRPSVQIDGDPRREIVVTRITPGAFARVSPQPLMGRNLVEADAARGAEPVVVLGEVMWEEWLDSDPEPLGRTVRLAGRDHTVVGIMPAAWRFPDTNRVWVPLPLDALADAAEASRDADRRAAETLVPWVVFADGWTEDAVETELTRLAQQRAPNTDEAEIVVDVRPYYEALEPSVKFQGLLLLSVLLIFLAAVSMNVASLMLARCAARASEISIRQGLGASRGRIIGQLFVEALVISGFAATLGIVPVLAALRWARTNYPHAGPFWVDLSISPGLLVYAAFLAVIAASVTGVLPALTVTRGDTAARLLSAGATRAASVTRSRFASILLQFQLASTLVLLTLAGLLWGGYRDLAADTFGPIPEERVLTADLRRDDALAEPVETVASAEQRVHDLRVELETTLAAIPGVEAAAVSLSVPGSHQAQAMVEVEESTSPPQRVQHVQVGPGFFAALDLEPVAGRAINATDASPGAPPVAMVSERFVATVLDGQSPIGTRLRGLSPRGDAGPWMEIVGIVPDVSMNSLDRRTVGEVYLPLLGADQARIVLLTRGDPADLAPAIRRAVIGVDPGLRAVDVQTLAEVGWITREAFRGVGMGLGFLGGLALVLSLAGIYALASMTVTARTREIGTRVALGATSGAVLRAILGRAALQIGLGVSVGSVAAYFAHRTALNISSVALPDHAHVAIPAAAAALLVSGIVSSWAPARRALSIEPMDALRSD